MPKFFVLASKVIELRGHVIGKDIEAAKQKARDHWYIHDTDPNTVTAGTAELNAELPIISEFEQKIKIHHAQKVCHYCDKAHDSRLACPEYKEWKEDQMNLKKNIVTD